jgi:hypothetical protein
MRFACQSCGKAYNLPEERIADKSNVKLKCRVCGAIVEVKKLGELVAQVLDETEFKHEMRVSEAPAPLISIGPEDDDDPEGATVSISEASLNDNGPLEFGFLGMPRAPAPAPGFAASSLPPPPVNRGESAPSPRESAGLPPSSPPPPMAPAPFAYAPLGAAPGGPPPLRLDAGMEALVNGSNGAGHYSLDENLSPRERAGEPLLAPAMKSPAALSPAALSPAALSSSALSSAAASLSSAARSSPAMSATPGDVGVTLGSATDRRAEPAASTDLYKMMFAAFVTGVVVDRIFAGLFF